MISPVPGRSWQAGPVTRTTPPRPLDVERVFPEVAPFRRGTVRLHPRAGAPTVWDSSVGGPLLWPEGEPWPTCAEHADVLVPVLQVFRADTWGALDFPPGATLLQLLWCQSDDHADGWVLPLVVWRDASAVRVPLTAPPKPESLQHNLIPRPCVVHPELVVEYPSAELPVDARDDERIDRVAAETGWDYDADLSVAPGTKLLGYPFWSQEPDWPTCTGCATPMRMLLTVASYEADPESRSWTPLEDFGSPIADPGLEIGDLGAVHVFECPSCPDRPNAHRQDCG
ncbi:hypothetical protein Amir_4305 [Actinosynnema mirum DSM 43827]|uniref:DUF1963 domain-containing protein n=1 Tax=Actinosynnema mirum (strain ATCC 29888 / DSM 43827 / JCM 3225 / NBRC 14064 / NCIMB 13271 / NRRL B-12336 / IMRU 3971 / 101) TaxID=446462 RepID=C6WIR8_ACTMD|nr:hypothetical protein Amir_4305 [Actinosynnema mirum DSM 43827]